MPKLARRRVRGREREERERERQSCHFRKATRQNSEKNIWQFATKANSKSCKQKELCNYCAKKKCGRWAIFFPAMKCARRAI